MRCLIVGKQEPQINRLSQYLKERGWQMHDLPSTASLKADGHAVARADLTIMKYEESDIHLGECIAAFRNASHNSVILVVGDFSMSARTRALSLGANDFVPSAVPLDLFQARISALLKLRSDRSSLVYELGELVVDVLH